jgi:hypothetical protein
VDARLASSRKTRQSPPPRCREFVLRALSVRTLGRWSSFIAVTALAFAGCKEKKAADPALAGAGVPVTESREVSGFTRLAVGSKIEAHVTIGEPSKLEFRGDKNLLPHLKSKVENGTLTLDTDVKVKPSIPLRVEFSVPRLDSVSARKGANVVIEKLNAETFEAKVVDGAKLRVVGSAHALVLEGTGAGAFDLRKLPAASATVRFDMAASAELGYVEKLDVKLTGMSKVVYDGTPVLTKEVSGKSRLVQRRL